MSIVIATIIIWSVAGVVGLILYILHKRAVKARDKYWDKYGQDGIPKPGIFDFNIQNIQNMQPIGTITVEPQLEKVNDLINCANDILSIPDEPVSRFELMEIE